MSSSKARVNITLAVETEGAQDKKELPCKLLVVGDFDPADKTQPVSERVVHTVTKSTFDDVMHSINPRLTFSVPNRLTTDTQAVDVDINFHSLRDFQPQEVALRVPCLARLIAMRHLLKDLRANVLDRHGLRKGLEDILKNQDNLKQLQRELTTLTQ